MLSLNILAGKLIIISLESTLLSEVLVEWYTEISVSDFIGRVTEILIVLSDGVIAR